MKSVYINALMPLELSIVIVNYRGWTLLSDCLKSIQALGDVKFSYEVIIVDNCSNDGYFQEFQDSFPEFKFILNSGNNGFSNGCNLGASFSHGEFLLFLNPDVIVSESSLNALLHTIKIKSDIAILSCKQINKRGNAENIIRFFPSVLTIFGLFRGIYRLVNQKALMNAEFDKNRVIYTDWVSGSLVLISKENFTNIKGWDEDYWLYYEDIDLCRRTSSQIGQIALMSDVNITHNHGGTTRINHSTSILTKTEVKISLHVYISKHYRGWNSFFMHTLVIIKNLIFDIFPAIFGVIFFFVKKINIKSHIYFAILYYYIHALIKLTWLSPRSINYQRNNL